MTVVLFSPLLAGCTNTYRFPVEEARSLPRHTYDVAVVPAGISGVVVEVIIDSGANVQRVDSSGHRTDPTTVTSRKLFRFDAQGGKLLPDAHVLTGITQKGDTIRVPYDSIVSLEFRGTDGGFAQMTLQRTFVSHDSLLAAPRTKLRREKYGNWDMLRFDERGGVLDTVSAMLEGKSRKGKSVAVPFADVYYVQYTESNPYKTIRVAATLALLGVLAFGPVRHVF